jgi:UDP-N-acetyl-2-amino-2-deoxyglucuronate dehydrogenase
MKAIKECGHDLVAMLDKSDVMGKADKYFPHARAFTEPELFDRHLEKLRRKNEGIDYLSICTPNWLHDAHCRMALRVDAHAICEKPLVLNPWNVEQLSLLEDEYERNVFPIMQLRYHPAVIDLQKDARSWGTGHRAQVSLDYISRRGHWYDVSWKGDLSKSGGVASNLGVHFFDMLLLVFGDVISSTVSLKGARRMEGQLVLEKADVNWFLSVDESDLPTRVLEEGGYAHRVLKVDGQEIDLTPGFTALHTKAYEAILNGNGLGLPDVAPVIELLHRIRTA